jgi:hypothetical protein
MLRGVLGRFRPSGAMLVAFAALMVALGGAAYAATTFGGDVQVGGNVQFNTSNVTQNAVGDRAQSFQSMIRGIVSETGPDSPAVVAGRGFTVSPCVGCGLVGAPGQYHIQFDIPFADVPVVTITPIEDPSQPLTVIPTVMNETHTGFDVVLTSLAGTPTDHEFGFIVIGTFAPGTS